MNPVVYDVHCHLYEFSDDEIARILDEDKQLRVFAVSDDLESFLRTLELSEVYPDRVIPCGGFHPWNLKNKGGLLEAEEIVRLAYRVGVSCFGEVGLDARFLSVDTMKIQYSIFSSFVELAVETGGFLILHSPDAWSEALKVIVDRGVERAVFHWYTGPLELATLISQLGYKISINPAVRVQEKHLRIAKSIPLDSIVFESDAPYEYKGLKLSPLMVRDTIRIIAEMRGLRYEDVYETARSNSEKLLGRILA